MKQIAIYRASGFGREVAWLIHSCGNYEVVCFLYRRRRKSKDTTGFKYVLRLAVGEGTGAHVSSVG